MGEVVLQGDVVEFAVLLWTAGRTDRVKDWSETDLHAALRWAGDLQAAAAAVPQPRREHVDKCLTTALGAAGLELPGLAAGGSALQLLGGERSGARAMLLHAIVHNVQFDWKAPWAGERGNGEVPASGGASLFVSALREFALLHAPSVHGDGGMAEGVESAAACVLLAQARKQAEADLLLMCCHRLSPLLPPDCVPQPGECPATADSRAEHGGGWWTRPAAIKSRAMARLLRKSAVKSRRGEELLQRVEHAVKELGTTGSQFRGSAATVGADTAASAVPQLNRDDGPNMLDICLWALVLPDADIPANHPEAGSVRPAQQATEMCSGTRTPPKEGSAGHGEGRLSEEDVQLRLVLALVDEGVRCALMQSQAWLLARAAARDARVRKVVLEEVRVRVRQGMVELLASAGAIAMGEAHAAWATITRISVLIGHLLLACAETRSAAAHMLEGMLGELGDTLAPLLARAVVAALARLMVPDAPAHEGTGAAHKLLASTPLHRVIPWQPPFECDGGTCPP